MRSAFTIKELEDGWDWNDLLEVSEMAEEYCLTILDIPSEYINDVQTSGEGLNIVLVKSKEYLLDDWYTNLSRVGQSYAKCA